MTKERKMIIAVVILILVAAVSLFSMNDSHQEVKKITQKLELRADSLVKLRKGYDSLSLRYDTLYTNLSSTKKQLYDYQKTVDSIMHSNITSLADMKSSLEDVIARQPNFERIDPSSNDDLF